MLTIFSQLAEIKSVGRQREKLALLRKYGSPTMKDILFYAFSPTTTFGIRGIRFDPEFPTSGSAPDVDEFLTLCGRLSRRDLVGNQAHGEATAHVMAYPPELRDLVAAFFGGRLSIGCDATLLNAALPGCIPTFGVQLAKEFSPEHMSYPAFASAKLDGMRCLLFATDKGVSLLTRTGKEIPTVPHIQDAFENLPYGIYDGELLHTNGDFNSTISVVRRKAPSAESVDIHFNVFDYIPLPEWGEPVTPAKLRFERLDEIHARYLTYTANPVWHVVQHTVIKNSLELAAFHDRMVNLGWEGTMIQFNVPYAKKRTYNLMKLKDFYSLEGVVYGVNPGTGKYRGMMGAVQCRDTKTGVEFDCGSGFTDEDRARSLDFWVGKVIEVKYQELIEGTGAPRFPVFLRLRDDLSE